MVQRQQQRLLPCPLAPGRCTWPPAGHTATPEQQQQQQVTSLPPYRPGRCTWPPAGHTPAQTACPGPAPSMVDIGAPPSWDHCTYMNGGGGECGFILHPCGAHPNGAPRIATHPHPTPLHPTPRTHVSVISTASAMAASLGLLLGLESQPDNSCSVFTIQLEG